MKRSEFIGALRAARHALIRDVHVLRWHLQRRRRIAEYLASHPIRRLHLGTGNNVIDGWLNTDLVVSHDAVVYLDATRPFPLDAGTFDYVMAEHMIEHVDYDAGQSVFRECLRVLKPGGRIRFATPDLRVILGLHARERTRAQQDYIDWMIRRMMPDVRDCREVFVVNNAFRAWGHRFLYDRDTLRLALSTAGFRHVTFFAPGVSDDPDLRQLERHGRQIRAEHINQFETIVAEAQKAVTPSVADVSVADAGGGSRPARPRPATVPYAARPTSDARTADAASHPPIAGP